MARTRGLWTFSRRGLRIYGGETGNVIIANVAVNADYEANGVMLAAAPALLEACEALLERYLIMGCGEGPEALKARAAISSAKGSEG